MQVVLNRMCNPIESANGKATDNPIASANGKATDNPIALREYNK
jgi:hypothetical protein